MSDLTTHELKISPQYFKDVIGDRKRFEVRYNDRNYKVGDLLRLREWENDAYSGQEATVQVIYMLAYPFVGLQEGYCVLGIERVWE